MDGRLKLTRNASEAREFIQGAGFLWHQRFQLVPGVYTPGVNDIEWLVQRCGVMDNIAGKSLLDIGTNNGAACFEAERRGAARVVGVDIMPPDFFGFRSIAQFLGSRAEYVQASVYELPDLLREPFDVVLFLGVLYHLRHPLLALDCVRLLTRGVALIETAVADAELPQDRGTSVARFFRRDELGHDPSNWFAPTVTCLLDWCASCGFQPELLGAWPEPAPQRSLVRGRVTAGKPEWQTISYERPLRAQVRT